LAFKLREIDFELVLHRPIETTALIRSKPVLREAKGLMAGPHGAAARLGLKRTTLSSKLKKLGIERDD